MNAISQKKQPCFHFVSLAFFLFFSCGITEYYFLEPPRENTPATGLASPDPLSNQYDFFIPNINTGGILLGYAVYYKIYNSVAEVQSAQSRIKSANILYSSQGMNTLKSMGYQQMFFMKSLGDFTDRIPRGPDNTPQRIIIRLINQGDSYISVATIDDDIFAYPYRYNQFPFNLIKSDGSLSDNFQPSSDLDTLFSSGSGLTMWYVNAYAAAFGKTSQFSPVYSQLTPLGVVGIPISDQNQ